MVQMLHSCRVKSSLSLVKDNYPKIAIMWQRKHHTVTYVMHGTSYDMAHAWVCISYDASFATWPVHVQCCCVSHLWSYLVRFTSGLSSYEAPVMIGEKRELPKKYKTFISHETCMHTGALMYLRFMCMHRLAVLTAVHKLSCTLHTMPTFRYCKSCLVYCTCSTWFWARLCHSRILPLGFPYQHLPLLWAYAQQRLRIRIGNQANVCKALGWCKHVSFLFHYWIWQHIQPCPSSHRCTDPGCLILWTSTCMCLIALFTRASTHILRAFHSADIGITTEATSNLSSTCVVLALVVNRQDCHPRPNSQQQPLQMSS